MSETADLVYFAHGKESGPWGRKITALAEIARARGFRVESPDYSDSHDPDQRVARLLALNPRTAGRLVLVGSSMGGYVSAVAAARLQPAGLFLIAPAVYLPGYEAEPELEGLHVAVVHGWDDELIPPDNAIRLARTCRATLHLLNGGHTLNERLPTLERLFGGFLDEIPAAGRQPRGGS